MTLRELLDTLHAMMVSGDERGHDSLSYDVHIHPNQPLAAMQIIFDHTTKRVVIEILTYNAKLVLHMTKTTQELLDAGMAVQKEDYELPKVTVEGWRALGDWAPTRVELAESGFVDAFFKEHGITLTDKGQAIGLKA